MFRLVWQCLRAPKLLKIYGEEPRESVYQPQFLERWGDKIISTASTVTNIGFYTSPFICMYICKRGFFSWQEIFVLTHLMCGVGCIIAFAYLMRSVGRAVNPDYVDFLTALTDPITDRKAYVDGLRRYDFDFKHWPASYVMPLKHSTPWFEQLPFSKCANPELPLYQKTTLQVLAYLATHTFAIRLIYPGSLGVVQNLLWYPLFQGRIALVENFGGLRAKLITAEGNSIDTMFIDHRPKSMKGNILVICCEGNSGFYEIGIMSTPLRAGYSVLGWNHPGFANSTGVPLPSQERNAIDVVVQYAINELDFNIEDIVMYGWSIGAYTATWAAVNYPDLRGLILDATFDDILPLAANQMPKSWYLLVKEVIRSYADLNIGDLVLQYAGPIQIVRRTEDEIICIRPGLISTNRGNNLLLQLLEMRHPDVPEVTEMTAQLKKLIAMTDTQRIVMARNEITDSEDRMLKLISKYMRDFRSTHCSPLPEEQFNSIINNLTETWQQNHQHE
ncbi:phosphatidylserine lipase ABHD16A isoform X2 [Epargyreus clarus]|uniref:phosphatidylserine lipase ABHD16A isoform X2 n=1 Tax=Epargyreus clarus TaxID=520877 RepID=UPI003C2C8F58